MEDFTSQFNMLLAAVKEAKRILDNGGEVGAAAPYWNEYSVAPAYVVLSEAIAQADTFCVECESAKAEA